MAEKETYRIEEIEQKKLYGTDPDYKHVYLWPLVLAHSLLHIGFLVGFYAVVFHMSLASFVWGYTIGFLSLYAVTIGAHRLYAHRSFKAKLPLRILTIALQTIAGQNSMYTWVRDHRCHHKYSDTDADPHNSTRGFFFCHMGWLMVKKHPLVKQKMKEIDMSDLEQDKLVMFQHKYYPFLYIPLGLIMPILVSVYLLNEPLWVAFTGVYCFRYVLGLHITWTVNSLAHLWGRRPYDKRIRAVQNPVTSFLTLGEGAHNYHHTFPLDYRLSDTKYPSPTTFIIELLAYAGQAYDLQKAPDNIVSGHARRHGSMPEKKLTTLLKLD